MNIQLNYIEKGKGEPLILLHGNGSNCQYFVNQMDEFAKGSCMVFVEGGHCIGEENPQEYNKQVKKFLKK